MFKSMGMLWVGLGVFFQAFSMAAEGLLSVCTALTGMAKGFEETEALNRIRERKALERMIAAEEAESTLSVK